MRAQSQAFDKTVWEGALIGGASTSLLMAVLSGQELAMLGGGAGAAAGGLAGSYVANKQKQYSNKEDVLNSMTADVRQSNADSRALIASVRAVIDEDKRRRRGPTTGEEWPGDSGRLGGRAPPYRREQGSDEAGQPRSEGEAGHVPGRGAAISGGKPRHRHRAACNSNSAAFNPEHRHARWPCAEHFSRLTGCP